jgi:TatD DNase family protein
MFIDTHCHLDMMVQRKNDKILSEDDFIMIERVLQESVDAGIGYIITIGTNLRDSIDSVRFAKRFDMVFATVGIHPCDCTFDWRRDFEQIKKMVREKDKHKIVGIGETGLDFYHKPFDSRRQKDVFKAHIELALSYDLPLVMHVRNAADEVLDVLQMYKNDIKGVMHCFSQNKRFADVILKWGLYVGINAPITYPKNHALRELVVDLPLNKILLETDAPFLPPQKFRGKPNKPAYIPLFARVIADLKQIDLNELESVTTENACRLFNIPQ